MKPSLTVVTPEFSPAKFAEPAWYRLHLGQPGRRRCGAPPPEAERIVQVGSAVELQMIQRELGDRLLETEALRIHECTICHKREAWLEGWQWYGSYETETGGSGLTVKTCSDDCQAAAIETGLAPADA